VGDVVPGDRDRGVAYLWEVGFDENGRGFVALDLVCGCCVGVAVSAEAFVVMVLAPDEVTVAVVVETCAAATSEAGDTASYAELDFA
jgi:predicted transporter